MRSPFVVSTATCSTSWPPNFAAVSPARGRDELGQRRRAVLRRAPRSPSRFQVGGPESSRNLPPSRPPLRNKRPTPLRNRARGSGVFGPARIPARSRRGRRLRAARSTSCVARPMIPSRSSRHGRPAGRRAGASGVRGPVDEAPSVRSRRCSGRGCVRGSAGRVCDGKTPGPIANPPLGRASAREPVARLERRVRRSVVTVIEPTAPRRRCASSLVGCDDCRP